MLFRRVEKETICFSSRAFRQFTKVWVGMEYEEMIGIQSDHLIDGKLKSPIMTGVESLLKDSPRTEDKYEMEFKFVEDLGGT